MLSNIPGLIAIIDEEIAELKEMIQKLQDAKQGLKWLEERKR